MARIAVDARLLFYRDGGIPNYISHLINDLPAMDSQRHHFAILQHSHDRLRFNSSQNRQRLSCLTPSHHFLERLSLGLELLPHSIDLLHSTDFIQPLWGYDRNIITVHDLAFLRMQEPDQRQSKSFYVRHIRDAVARADHIITISDATRKDLLSLFPIHPGKVTTIHLGIDPAFFPRDESDIAAARERYGLPSRYLLFVGTIEPRKNIVGLLKAYAILVERISSDIPPMVFVGKKGWNTEGIYQERDNLHLGKNTLWLENVTFDDLPAVYSGAEMLVLPSHYEGFGFPPLESMACGTPSVVANNSSLPEIAGDAGFYVDSALSESIADGMLRVLTDSNLRDALIKKGRERVKGFTWQKTVAQTLDVYRQVLGDKT